MPSYVVRWEIEVEADDSETAVIEALESLPFANPDSLATFFDVWTLEDADDPNVRPIQYDAARLIGLKR